MGFSKEQLVILFLIGLTIFSIDLFRPFHPVWSKPSPPSTGLTTDSSPQWIVEVAGAVRSPGIYAFHAPPMVNDALQKAGGLVSRHGSMVGRMNTPLETGTRLEIQTSEPKPDGVIISAMDPGKKFVLGIPVPLNQADAEDLAIIPGISQNLAHRIVEFRDLNGPFRSFHDLDRVRGVGPKTLQRLSYYLSIEEVR
jgi:competence protein ComEA